jgi:error-prone DNA polymerase
LRAVGDVLPLAPAGETAYAPRPLDAREVIFQDYEATGICVSGHPMEHLRARLRSAAVLDSQSLDTVPDGAHVRVSGLVTVRQRPMTSKGTIFLLLEDEFGYINVVVTKAMAERYRDIVKHAPFVVADGWLARDDGAVNVIGTAFRRLRVSHRLTHDVHNFH